MLSVLAIAFAAYAGFGLALYLAQDSLLYYPTAERTDDSLANFRLRSDDVSLKIWKANPGHERAVLYFGGNSEDPEPSLDSIKALLPVHTVYAVNYRGYGGSTGKPSQDGIFKDALNVYDYVKKRHSSISAIGRSLGTGVALYLAVERKIDRLALITPYDSILKVAERQYPVYPISIMLRDQYDSLSIASKIRNPTLILIAERDRVVPPAHAENLAREVPAPWSNQIIIPQARHDNIHDSEDYIRHLSGFFAPDDESR